MAEHLWEPKITVEMDGHVPDICLPFGWIALNHKCGGIIYLHKETRVVTWSRPYILDKDASVRKHDVPLVSIPCLHQMLAPHEKKKTLKRKLDNVMMTTFNKKIKLNNDKTVCVGSSLADKVEAFNCSEDNSMSFPSNNDFSKDINIQFINSGSLHSYLQKIFRFNVLDEETTKIPLFSEVLCEKKEQTSSTTVNLPKITKSKITVDGKTPKQILHEYVQKHIKVAVEYKKLDTCWQNDRTDLYVEVVLGDVKYAIGSGGTIKLATQEAAALTMEILDPKLQLVDESDKKPHLQEFDNLLIEDSSIYKKAKESKDKSIYTPFEALLRLLKRRVAPSKVLEKEIICNITAPENEGELYSYQMNYKDYSVSGTHTNKHCKHTGSQYLIKQMFPFLQSWGSVLRLAQVKWRIDYESQKSSSSPRYADKVTSSPYRSTSTPSHLKGSSLLMDKLKTEMRKMT